MDQRRLLYRAIPIAIALLVVFFQYFSAEKFTNEAGRTVHVALNPAQEKQLGLQSYQQVLQEERTVDSGPDLDMVKRVAGRLAQATGAAGKNFDWAVSLVQSDQVNAFCLPGGKVVVYTGILPVSKAEAGLATVMGHEMAHATCRHGSERLLAQKETQTVMTGVQYSLGDMSYETQRAVMGSIGMGAKYGLLMPFSREHESEADAVGLMYLARAGYDPHEALTFWQRMESMNGRGQPPAFMSDHPSHGARIEQIKKLLPKALEEFQKSGAR